MVRLALFAACFLVALAGNTQSIEFEVINKLPASINSGCEEIAPMLSADGKTLYFARSGCDFNTGGRNAGTDVWISEFNNNSKTWGKPKNAGSDVNDKGHNAIIGIGPDGRSLYAMNTFPSRKIRGFYTKGKDRKWTLEEVPFLETQEHFGMFVSPDGKTMVISMKRQDGFGEDDLYVSRKGNANDWSEPINLGNVVNSIGYEISPFLSADTRRLYFASNGHRGLGGCDIFYSDRLDDSWKSWSAPVNLGNLINTEAFDAYFVLHDSVAIFSSNADLYTARIKKAEDPTRQAVRDIVAEASSLLDDLNDDTYDSLANYRHALFVTFEPNTAILSRDAVRQLDEAVDVIRMNKDGRLTLVAYVNRELSETGQLWDKRLEEIRNYLRKKSGLDLLINHEIVQADLNQPSRKGSVVEVRYN